MSEAINWLVEANIKTESYEKLENLAAEIVTATKANEPGTTRYEWFISWDKKICHIYEQYNTSNDAILHLGNYEKNFADRVTEALDITGCMVFGNPSSELKEILDGFGATYMSEIGGFTR